MDLSSLHMPRLGTGTHICIPLLALLLWGPGVVEGRQSPSDLFQDGRVALEAGRTARAQVLLDSLWHLAPAWIDSRHGAASYWRGVAAGQLRGPEAAARIWSAGLDSLAARDAFDLRLADAYLAFLSRSDSLMQRELPRAVTLYVNLINNLDAVLEPEEFRIALRHLAQLSLILPQEAFGDAVRGRPLAIPMADGRTQDVDARTWSVRAGAGPRLVSWWRGRDPLPATRSNERLEEHLLRTAHSMRAYADPMSPAGVDARGMVYIRYGAPQEQIEVTFDDPVLTDIVYRPGVAVSLSDFPENEFWVYGHIDRNAWYLFVRKGGRFVLGETEDLVPPSLRFGFTAGTRGRIKAGMTIAVLQNIFRQLAPLHSDFAVRYAEVDNYAMQMPEFAAGRMAARSGRPLSGLPGGVQGGTQTEQPGQFAQTVIVKSRSEDDASLQRREEVMPLDYTAASEGLGRLEVGFRAVRFLEPDGSTRTDIYWSPEPGRISPGRAERRLMESMAYPETGRFLLTVTAVQQDREFIDRLIVRDRLLITSLPDGTEAIPPQRLRLSGRTDTVHVGLQWDQLAMPERGSAPGPALRIATARLDSLPPLSADPSRPELSDLLPLVGPADEVGSGKEPGPYPFRVLSRDQQLGLSFEIYHLTFGPDDRTHYAVSFEVDRSRDRGGFLSLRPRSAESTRSTFSGTGTSRIAQEMILVELQDWEGSGELEVRVLVTDEVTGRTVERSIAFELR